MKKQIILIIGALIYSLLFYQNSFGLNIVLFSLLSVTIVGICNSSTFNKKITIALSMVYVITSILFFINDSALALVSNIVSFFIFLGSVSERKSSMFIKLFNGFFSTIVSTFYHYFNRNDEEITAAKKKKINYVFWLKIIGIPMLTLSIFVILYRSANPVFDQLLQQIDFSFINLQWLVFTVLGYFLLLNITEPATIDPITTIDISTSNHLSENEIKNQPAKELIQENQLGIVLLTVLNMLILFFLITDGIYLHNITDITASGLSNTVHEGVYALITSIVFAISIILYFFRGNLNFYKKNKNLRALTMVWIALNVVLIFTTSYKNYLYASHYGLTYKRIGVFIYLLLALVGLLTTFIKVNQKNNFWFLLRKNVSIAFIVLITAGAFNWDVIITNYNIDYAKITDIQYLLQLRNNTIILKEHLDKNRNKLQANEARLIVNKYDSYTKEQQDKKWQEYTYANLKRKL